MTCQKMTGRLSFKSVTARLRLPKRTLGPAAQPQTNPSTRTSALFFFPSHRVFTLQTQVHAGAASSSGPSFSCYILKPRTPFVSSSRSPDWRPIARFCARLVRQQACSGGSGSWRWQRRRSTDEQDTTAAAAAGGWLAAACGSGRRVTAACHVLACVFCLLLRSGGVGLCSICNAHCSAWQTSCAFRSPSTYRLETATI
jgi:hypothetical protein